MDPVEMVPGDATITIPRVFVLLVATVIPEVFVAFGDFVALGEVVVVDVVSYADLCFLVALFLRVEYCMRNKPWIIDLVFHMLEMFSFRISEFYCHN